MIRTFTSIRFLWILTAVLFVRGAVVIAVVDAVANVVFCNTAAIVASELSVWVTRFEQTAHLITVVSTVVIVVTAVVVRNTPAIATSKDCGLTGVEGCQSESKTGQSSVIRKKKSDIHKQWKLILPDKAIKDDSNCGTACKDISTLIHLEMLICFNTVNGNLIIKSKHTHQHS